MPRGGYRPGAGRKKRHQACDGQADAFNHAEPQQAEQKPVRRGRRSPLKLLLDVVEDDSLPLDVRMRAATSALPFTHKKPSDIGKKQDQLENAKRIQSRGKFGARPTPQNVVPFGKKEGAQ